jgi:hypothetical protein
LSRPGKAVVGQLLDGENGGDNGIVLRFQRFGLCSMGIKEV